MSEPTTVTEIAKNFVLLMIFFLPGYYILFAFYHSKRKKRFKMIKTKWEQLNTIDRVLLSLIPSVIISIISAMIYMLNPNQDNPHRFIVFLNGIVTFFVVIPYILNYEINKLFEYLKLPIRLEYLSPYFYRDLMNKEVDKCASLTKFSWLRNRLEFWFVTIEVRDIIKFIYFAFIAFLWSYLFIYFILPTVFNLLSWVFGWISAALSKLMDIISGIVHAG